MRHLLRPVTLLAAAAVVAATFFAVRWWLGPQVPAVAVTRGGIVQTVVSTGRVITPARVEIGAVITGTAVAVRVKEGDQVKQDQVLAGLQDEELRAALAQARAALREAEARVTQLAKVGLPVSEQTVAQAAANLELAEREHARIKQLYESGFYGKARLDEAERNLDNARAAHKSALAQAASNRPQGSDYALAIARQSQARAAVEVAEAKLANTVIRAPADGTVLRKFVEPGDVVQPGKKLFEMSVAGETQLVLQVDEKNLRFLRLGQAALAVADAYPGGTFSAEIFYIAPSVDAQRGSVEVKLRVPDPPEFLRPDMTVSAEIEAARKSDAVIVASDAVRDAAGPSPWIMIAADGRAARRPVRLGIRGVGKTELLEGAAPGDLVIPPSVAGVMEGARVRAVADGER
ncbi:MAG: efflux RND transporter periplasmic adaptor subunit [Burkholderiales bacterium]|nr:efflux RND transporter periplasmic adaptor subunit [Burkholderiales bacterium]